MPDDAEQKVTARLAEARAAFETADGAVMKESKKRLDALLRLPVTERFKAIETADPTLAPEHRRALLRSIREGSRPTSGARVISVTVASRWEVFLSRLPYRVVPLAIAAMLVLAAVVLITLARQRTPERWVEVASRQDAPARWRQPGGTQVDGRIVAGRKYALTRRIGAEGVLRDWVPGQGYAETQVPLDWVREASGSTTR